MKILLISPPVGNFGQATPGISVLTAWMRARGHECVQWDLAIDAFHHFHSRTGVLDAVARIEEQRAADPRSQANPEVDVILAEGRDVAERIDWAKARIREPGVERDARDMKRAMETIRDAGVVIGTAYRCGFGYNRLDIRGAYHTWDGMRDAVTMPEKNLFIEYFERHVMDRIEREAPDVVGLSITYMSQFLPALALTHLIQRSFGGQVKTLLGGSFITSIQDDLLKMPGTTCPADGMVFGDGEGPLLQFVEQLETGHPDVSNIPNLAYRDGDRFVMHPQEAMTRLDELPSPMLEMEGIHTGDYLVPKYPIALPLTRGCYWGKCTFCNISNQARMRYRRRSMPHAIEDIRTLIEVTGSNWFDFAVDSFPPADLRRLAQQVKEAGIEIEWAAEVLLDAGFTRDTLFDMAAAGCRGLRFGLESASQETLKHMVKRVDLDVTRRILKDCREAGIKTSLMCIVGFPTESQSQLRETVDFLIENAENIDFVTLHEFSVVPGTPIANDPDRFGIQLLPKPAVINPALPWANHNPISMRPGDTSRTIDLLVDILKEHFPNIGELWTSAIGGWLTFPASCSNDPSFFKTVWV